MFWLSRVLTVMIARVSTTLIMTAVLLTLFYFSGVLDERVERKQKLTVQL